MDIYKKISEYKDNGTACIVATVVEKSGEGPVEVGKKMVVGQDGRALGTVGGGALEFHAREKCKELLESRGSIMEKYLLNEGEVVEEAKTLPMVCGGEVSIFYEYIGPDAYVYIFGAGHVGQAVSNVLKTMNFHVTVIDDRPEVCEAFRGADEKFNMSFVEYIEDKGIPEGSYVLICTPSHKYDYNVIERVIELETKPRYMGMLCSIPKLRNFVGKIYEKYGEDVDLSYLYSPVGLDTGGGSPAEIAVSIAAELLAVLHGKEGHRHMRPGEYKW
ncbi:MAG: XdhC/CoxI family protein [Clostridia bacterium]|nr:XdhC/CoxI family protein [Clostridia bacterium]